MTINEDVVVNVSDLLKKDTLLDQLDESEAFALGVNFKEVIKHPEFMAKFGEKLLKVLTNIRDKSDRMEEIRHNMTESSTLKDFVEKCINAYESKEDRVVVALSLGIYVADMYYKSLEDE